MLANLLCLSFLAGVLKNSLKLWTTERRSTLHTIGEKVLTIVESLTLHSGIFILMLTENVLTRKAILATWLMQRLIYFFYLNIWKPIRNWMIATKRRTNN